jgi:hypothetical protein
LFVLTFHYHLLSFSLLDVIAHFLVHNFELFNTLDYKQLKVFFDASDVSNLSLQGVDSVLVGVDLPFERVVLNILLIAALNVPSDFPSVSLAVIRLQLFDVILKLVNLLAFVAEQGLIVSSFLGELPRDQGSFSFFFHQNGPRLDLGYFFSSSSLSSSPNMVE